MRWVVACVGVLVVAGCLQDDNGAAQAPTSSPAVTSTARLANDDQTLARGNATSPAPPSFNVSSAQDLPGLRAQNWTRLSFDLYGKGGEWLWFYEPLTNPSASVGFSAGGSVRGLGAGKQAAFLMVPTLVAHNDGASGSSVDSLDEMVAGAAEGPVTRQFWKDGWIATCTNCTYIGVMGAVGATTDWTAHLSFSLGGETELDAPSYTIHSRGISFEELHRSTAFPLGAGPAWRESRAVDAGLTLWSFWPGDDPAGYGNVTADFVGERWSTQSDSGTHFIKVGAPVPYYAYNWTQWTKGFMGHEPATATFSVDRAGTATDLRAFFLHASGFTLPVGLVDGGIVTEPCEPIC